MSWGEQESVYIVWFLVPSEYVRLRGGERGAWRLGSPSFGGWRCDRHVRSSYGCVLAVCDAWPCVCVCVCVPGGDAIL